MQFGMQYSNPFVLVSWRHKTYLDYKLMFLSCCDTKDLRGTIDNWGNYNATIQDYFCYIIFYIFVKWHHRTLWIHKQLDKFDAEFFALCSCKMVP